MIMRILGKGFRFLDGLVQGIRLNYAIVWARLRGGKCCVVEIHPMHYEVLPSIIAALNGNGIVPHVFMANCNKRNDIFNGFPELHFIALSAGQGSLRKKLSAIIRSYRRVIYNTLDEHGNSRVLAGSASGSHVWGIEHNISVEEIAGIHKLVLLPYNRSQARIFPCYYRAKKRAELPDERLLVIQGNIAPGRRNYSSFLRSFAEIRGELGNLKFVFVGFRKQPFYSNLLEEIRALGLGDSYLDAGEKNLTYSEFFRLVEAGHFILPLIDRSEEYCVPYFENKLTSSIPLAIGVGIPLVVNSELARKYSIDDGCITYDDDRIGDGLRFASRIFSKEYGEMLEKSNAIREKSIAENIGVVGNIVKDARGSG